MRIQLLAAAATLGLALAGPALGKPKVDPPAPTGLTPGARLCLLADITPAATGCAGWYEGNLNGGSPDKLADQAEALNLLVAGDPYTGPTLTWLGDIDGSAGDDGDFDGDGSGNFIVDFDQLLFGDTIVSFHVGAAKGQSNGIGYNATAFFRFDAGDDGLDTFKLNVAGLSNARLYVTGTCDGDCGSGGGIPEPATWALMIMGFGSVGALMRRRRPGLA